MTMKQLIASYDETLERTNNIKANTGLTKVQTLSEEQRQLLLEIETEMAAQGFDKNDSGIDRLIKSVLNNIDIFTTNWKPDTEFGKFMLSILKSAAYKKYKIKTVNPK